MANNGGYDNMNNQANAGLALLASLFLGGTAIAARNASNRKKAEERAEKQAALEHELQEVRYELSKLKGNIFKEAWYASEIAQLEECEKKLIQAINNL